VSSFERADTLALLRDDISYNSEESFKRQMKYEGRFTSPLPVVNKGEMKYGWILRREELVKEI
jgi:hypothetical protein